ncbi:sugar transferase [Streptococcus suis]|uniref:Glycosyl-1-phosphate transferase n=1 Tax=Streptococcus suis TaxID=1307 RepID=A0A0F6S2U2_STRSU|nr:sugar transferase [Streptococcus suis]AKE79609.1 glycosyl-1-phosphate transferase [Streptococcus suis]AKE80332.1 glycosyl-1-phosphate transferase [Streptococcus suis]AKE80478.1 glycosyl-1-phosphate transferase [Streptococcus suis]AKE80499.1 glycosyl-1-phosphate transferase [Streptococcus suis]AKE80520.1 glycosyl-1-phosphate transferase [Streptococcus suis]
MKKGVSITKELLKTNEITSKYFEKIESRKFELFLKFFMDKLFALILLLLLLPLIIVLAVWIKLDSTGPVFYRQERVTQYGRVFKIFKFRTMVTDADKVGSLVTIGKDNRITQVGHIIRKYRLDEIPQLFNVLMGDMSFVGVRPEVQKYVDYYTDEMLATLILPAGITSPASIAYKDEDNVLEKYCLQGYSPDEAYVQKVLPEKMKYNLEYIRNFGIISDFKVMIDTVVEVIK